MLYHLRSGTIGVQFNQISQIFDLSQKFFQVCSQCRLSSRNTYSVQNPFPFFQKSQDILSGIIRLFLRMQHQYTVLAKGTSKITSSQKYGTGYLSRIIQQSCFIKSADSHDIRLLSSAGKPLQTEVQSLKHLNDYQRRYLHVRREFPDPLLYTHFH